jgi:hypothetical protein
MTRFHRIAIAAAGAVALLAAGAGTAFAGTTPPSQGGSVNASISVVAAEAISFTGLSPSFSFPTTTAGDTAMAPGAESYNVSITGPGNGFTLTITPSAASLSDGASHTIPDADLSVTEVGSLGTAPYAFTGGAPFTDGESNVNPSSWNLTENWALAVPPMQFPATYSIGLTYLIMANS